MILLNTIITASAMKKQEQKPKNRNLFGDCSSEGLIPDLFAIEDVGVVVAGEVIEPFVVAGNDDRAGDERGVGESGDGREVGVGFALSGVWGFAAGRGGDEDATVAAVVVPDREFSVGDGIEHAGVEPVDLGFGGVVGVEIADFEVNDGEGLVALSDNVAVVGTGGKSGGNFGEGGGINERFEAAERVRGGFVVRREAALVDEELIIDGVGKIIVVVVVSEGDGEMGIAGGGG